MTTVAAFASAVALSGCWPVPGQGPDRTAHNALETALTPATVGGLHQEWASDPVGARLEDPIVTRGRVVAATGTEYYAFDTATGGAEWTWQPDEELPSPSVMSAPFAVGDRILVGYGSGSVWSEWFGTWLDPATGTPTGSAPVTGVIQGVRGDRAATTSYAYGNPHRPTAVNFAIVDLESSQAVARGLLDFGPLFGDLASPLTLGQARLYHAGPGVIPPETPDDPPSTAEAVRAFPANEHPEDCDPNEYPGLPCPLWATPLGSAPTAVVIGPGEQAVYVGTSAGAVVALDAATGAVIWTTEVGAAVDHPPALADGILYVPTADGDLVAVAASDGTTLWTATTGTAAVASQPAVAGAGDDAVVYVGTATGGVQAFAASADGCGDPVCTTPLWSATTGSEITGGPIVTGGRVYVTTADGRVVAHGLP